MSFSRKTLAASFSFADGTSQNVSGLRMSARIATPGGDDSGTMVLLIFGLTLDHMNALTVLPQTLTAVGVNTVTLMAGENGTASTIVFQGNIQFAAVDANAQPEVAFRVQAYAGGDAAVKPVPALSQPGSQDAAALFGSIAKSMGRTLEDGGITARIQNPYLPGTAKQQASALARAIGCQWLIEGDKLAVWPAGQPRPGEAVTISKDNGMVGYPSFSASGISVVTLFQAPLKFGCKINVQSSLQPACGDWFVHYIEYALDCQIPNGKWFAILSAGRINVSDNA